MGDPNKSPRGPGAFSVGDCRARLFHCFCVRFLLTVFQTQNVTDRADELLVEAESTKRGAETLVEEAERAAIYANGLHTLTLLSWKYKRREGS